MIRKEASKASMVFNVFGSPSSLDLDVIVFLDKLPPLEECKKLALQMNKEIESLFIDNKKANTNFAVIQDGVIVKVFKGTPDEVNNSILMTYDHHKQQHPCQVNRLLPRDFHQKILRASRIILSFYSRTDHRQEVKWALGGDLIEKIECLRGIDFSKEVDFGKNGSQEDVLKNIAFQLGQVIGLSQGKEYYSKEDIASGIPELAPLLRREKLSETNMTQLDLKKNKFIRIVDSELSNMKKLVE